MKTKCTVFLILCVLLFGSTSALYSNVGLNMGFSYSSFVEDEETIHLAGISVKPDFSFGNWGVGLDTTFNFRIGGDPAFQFFSEDWVPDWDEDASLVQNLRGVAGLYLPIFRYVRYGHKGDNLYGRIGMLDEYTLGTGVFMDRYANTMLLPQKRISGLVVDLDGRLFNFPYVGLETVIGNLAETDVLGARLFSRPFAFVDFPVVRSIQVGASYITDRNPAALDAYMDTQFTEDPEAVSMFGADMLVPLLPFALFSLDLFADAAFQAHPANEDLSRAFRTGIRGKIIELANYTLDLTIPSNGYKPYYFDKRYDLNRLDKYTADGLDSDDQYFLRGSAGFDLFDENLVVDILLQGEVANGFKKVENPSMTAYLKVGEDLMPFFFFDAYYTKHFTGEVESLDMFIDGILEPGINSTIEVKGNMRYKLFLTTIGISITYDEVGERTVRTSIAGDLQLDRLLGFLQ